MGVIAVHAARHFRGFQKGFAVAEFVGEADTAHLLRESGVDYAQGYHVGPPRPVMEVSSSFEAVRAALEFCAIIEEQIL